MPQACLIWRACFSFGGDTLDKNALTLYAVTVRDRDTMQQERIPISALKEYLAEKIKF